MSRPSAISPELFVRVWNTAKSAKHAAAALGMTRVGARSRARNYRLLGIPLRRFPSSTLQDHLDVRTLSKFAVQAARLRKASQ